MDITLHTGAHRTATQSFLAFCGDNSAAIDAANVACWGRTRTRQGLFAGLLRHPARTRPADDQRAYRATGRIRSGLAQLTHGGASHLVVSEPQMIGDMADNLATIRLYPDVVARLKRIEPAFRAHPLKIALSVRSFEGYWTSLMARALPLGMRFPSMEYVDQLVTQPRRWSDVARDISRVFPDAEILVLPHETFAARPDRMLGLLCGAPVDGLGAPGVHHIGRRPDRTALVTTLRDRGESAAAKTLEQSEGPWRPFPESHSDALRQEYEEDLTRLRDGVVPQVTFIDDAGRHPRAIEKSRGQSDDAEERHLGRDRHSGTAGPPA